MATPSFDANRDSASAKHSTATGLVRDRRAKMERPNETNVAKHIGALKGKIQIKGDIFSTGLGDQ